MVGKARLDAYGGIGGGYFRRIHHRQAENESSLLGIKICCPEMGGGASSECGVRNSKEDSYVVVNNLDDLMKAHGLVSFSQQDLGQTNHLGLYVIRHFRWTCRKSSGKVSISL